MVFKKGNIPLMKGKHHTLESIRKMSESHRLHPTKYWLGKHRSEETNKKIGFKNLGKKRSEETKLKMSLVHKSITDNAGRFKKGAKGYTYWLGKKMSEEIIRKKSESLKGHLVSKETREKLSKIHTSPKLLELHRKIRLGMTIPSKDTSIERKLQDELSGREIGYYKHYPVIGQPDIAFPDKKVAVFADGEYWHEKKKGMKEKDSRVNEKLRSEGWKVLRYREQEINDNPEGVVDEIEEIIVR
jgi:DNA mismatch endonuclease (patch repair protein)